MMTMPCGVTLRMTPSRRRSFTCAEYVLPSGPDTRATYELRLCMTPRTMTSPVDSPANPVSFLPPFASMPRDSKLTNGSRRPEGSYVYASAAGGGAGVVAAGAAGCGDPGFAGGPAGAPCAHTRLRSEEHTSELQSQSNLVCRLLLEKKKKK